MLHQPPAARCIDGKAASRAILRADNLSLSQTSNRLLGDTRLKTFVAYAMDGGVLTLRTRLAREKYHNASVPIRECDLRTAGFVSLGLGEAGKMCCVPGNNGAHFYFIVFDIHAAHGVKVAAHFALANRCHWHLRRLE